MRSVILLVVITIATVLVPPRGVRCSVTEVPEKDLRRIESELEIFATSLSNATLSNITALSESIREYLDVHGPAFFGSTVTVLSSPDERARYSPYVYWNETETGLVSDIDSLMDPSYGIDGQEWLRRPIDEKKAVWTDPYFDAGGGNVWMKTRSYPIIQGGGDEQPSVVAVATTDVHIPPPPDTLVDTSETRGLYPTTVLLLLVLVHWVYHTHPCRGGGGGGGGGGTSGNHHA